MKHCCLEFQSNAADIRVIGGSALLLFLGWLGAVFVFFPTVFLGQVDHPAHSLISALWYYYCCQIFLFTEVSRSGVAGCLAANHVDGGLSIAIVYAPIPRQQTKEETAWEQLKNLDGVTRVYAQVILSSPFGCHFKGTQQRYFELFWPSTKLPFIWRKHENNSLQR